MGRRRAGQTQRGAATESPKNPMTQPPASTPSPSLPEPLSANTREDAAKATTGLWFLAGHLWTIWGIALSNVFLGLSSLWCFREGRSLSWRRPHSDVVTIPLLFYILCFLIAMVGSIDPRISLAELHEILSLPTLILTLLLVRGERDARRLVDGLMILIGVLAVLGIAQNYLEDLGTLHRRVKGLFSHYQTFAGVLLLGDCLLVARLAASRDRRPWHWAALVAVNWALLLTLTRGAWVAFLGTLGIFAVLRVKRRFALYFSAGVTAFVLFLVLVPGPWTTRMQSIVDLQDPSNYDRLCMADAALYMIGERPFFGIGPEMVRHLYPIYRHPTAPRFQVPHLHNTFLQLAAEQGLMSLAAYLWLMVASLSLAWRGYRRHPGRSPADLYLGVFLAIVAFNIAGLFEDNWRDTEVQRLILFLLALPVCLRAEEARQGCTKMPASSPEEPNSNGAE